MNVRHALYEQKVNVNPTRLSFDIVSPFLQMMRKEMGMIGVNKDKWLRSCLGVTPAMLACTLAHANEPPVEPKPLATVQVIATGGEAEPLGNAQVLHQADLDRSRAFTVNEALRKLPGLNVRDEEGFGLRPNIGFRGLNPTRSTKVTLLEDGLPLAYAPYGDNASYYHPPIDRYARIEVLKGANTLRFGPQTIGGVINYVTPEARQAPGGYVQMAAGNRGFKNLRMNWGNGGFAADFTRKAGDGARDNTRHQLDDLNLKYTAALNDQHALTLRANLYEEQSTVTYAGLTQAEFERQGPRYNPFRNDEFSIFRTGLSATHDFLLDTQTTLTSSVYYSQFDRDWWRQASSSQDAQCGPAFNQARLAGDVVDPGGCNSVQGRLRFYETWGVEPRLIAQNSLGEFQLGLKAHVETQSRQQVNGLGPNARTGALSENNARETTAFAFFLSQRFDWGPVSVTPIVRHESIDVRRTNRLNGTGGQTSLQAVLPGLSADWRLNPKWTAFASVHRGFAPPRVEDLIGVSGTVTEVDAEESVQFEAGAKGKLGDNGWLNATVFRNDFDNLIAVGSIAGGSTPLSQGQALFQGFELDLKSIIAQGWSSKVAYTWLPEARQTTAFRSVVDGSAVGFAGRRQPYAPEHTLTAALRYEQGSVATELEAQHIGRQFSDFANTVASSPDGQRGEIPANTLWNASVNIKVDTSTTAFIVAKNLLDTVAIVDRTRGILTAVPRLIQFGVRYQF